MQMERVVQKSQLIPIIFGYNLSWRLLDVYNTSHFAHIPHHLGLNGYKCYLLGNRTHKNSTIMSRAQTLKDKLQEITIELNVERVHLVGYSFLGVDARAMISLLEGNKMVSSLTTICSPHLGSRLAYQLYHHQGISQPDLYEPSLKLLGLSTHNLEEYIPQNIQSLNDIAHNDPQIFYFSMGSSVPSPESVIPMLRGNYSIIKGDEIGNYDYDNDGMTLPSESVWGKYLVTMDGDHTQIVGLSPNYNARPIFRLIADNLSLMDNTDLESFRVMYNYQNEYANKLDTMYIQYSKV